MVTDLVTLKTPSEVLADKRRELNACFNELFEAENEYRKKKSAIEAKMEELKRQIYKLSKEIEP